MQRCRTLGRPPTKQYTKSAARALLRLSNSSKIITKDWWRGQKKQHKHLYKRIKTKPLSAERKAGVQQIEIQVHFQDFYRRVQELNIDINDIYNFDETGFCVGYQAGQWVLVHFEDKSVYMADPDNRESLTLVECVSGSGFALPPMIIISGIIFLEKYFMNELSDDVLLATSDTGYMNDQLSLDQIHHFDAYTKQ